jgi:DNA processing protein
LAIIGTREITSGGEKAGLYLAKEFAKRGLCIVSGLAIGCDTCGHRGALAVGGKTVAFLAHGLDTIYPPENEGLAKEIVEKGGLLVSEYPAGTPINRHFLVARDRLQAGLAKATLVIQTGVSGGTMHASNTTLEAGKTLYVVSFSDDETRNNEKTKGNEFLAKKGAKYIKGDDDLDKIADEIKNFTKLQTKLF